MLEEIDNKAFKQGDRKLKAAARNKGCNDDEANDLVQSSYLESLKKTFASLEEFFRHTGKVLQCKLVDRYRMARAHPELSLESSPPLLTEPDAIEKELVQKEKLESLNRLVLQLSAEDQRLFAMMVDNLAYLEIARILQISPAAARQRASDLRRKLRVRAHRENKRKRQAASTIHKQSENAGKDEASEAPK